MAHLACGLYSMSASLDADQFVVAPEGAIEKQNIYGFKPLHQLVAEFWNRGHVG